MFAPAVLGPTVDVLHELAGEGPALELAIGTGRVALPLAERGVEVHGIDVSEAMVAQLRRKPGGDRLAVTIGDMATTRVGSGYRLAYLVYNTITNLLTQDEQVECFRTVAEQLAPRGCFVVEVFVPQLRRMPPGQTAVPFHVGSRHVGFDTVDVVSQLSVSHHYVREGQQDAQGRELARYAASAHRYVWPSELDLMARIASLTLTHRWADWDRTPFTAESESHVSVWTKGGA
ncbi:class I SAM-dependent DNA methyltransferase [Terrabacter sp. Soil811]|nr:class I SAM-dependent methyltransferase [Terrabacter sp. Soil811]